MNAYANARDFFRRDSKRWLVTGAAGFIGSNLVEGLLHLGQGVVGIDNLSTGHRRNIEDVRRQVGAEAHSRFHFLEADVRDIGSCREVCEGIDIVLHQAALGSVPRSIEDPLATHQSNVEGFVNLLVAARETGVGRLIYASSSSVYGDHPGLPKVEDAVGRPLSPYAVTKVVDELYADIFQRTFGLETIGLRYFNVFGRRQDPNGAYAAVIPRWVGELLHGVPSQIYGDGETSRDFCYIANVVQANLLAAVAPSESTGEVYNIATGSRTTLNELFRQIRDELAALRPELAQIEPDYSEFRIGDVRHSQADISKAREQLGYEPTHSLREGLREALPWYVEQTQNGRLAPGATGRGNEQLSPVGRNR